MNLRIVKKSEKAYKHLPTKTFGFRGVFNDFKPSDHDNLARCANCSMKYKREELRHFGGRLICSYCIEDLEMNITYTGRGKTE